MRSRLMTAILAGLPALVLAMASGPVAGAAPARHATPAASTTVPVRKACGAAPTRGRAECMALLRVAANGAPLTTRPAASSAPPGYGPEQLQAAYELAAAAASRGGDQTVALVDAFDDPNAEADLARYRAQFGLPACTTANGCFRKGEPGRAAKPAARRRRQLGA